MIKNLQTIAQIASYAAALVLLSASRASTNEQWTATLGQWAVMIFVVLVGRVGWAVLVQIADETRKVIREQRAKAATDEIH